MTQKPKPPRPPSRQRHHHLSRYHLRLRGLGAMTVTRTHFTFRIDALSSI